MRYDVSNSMDGVTVASYATDIVIVKINVLTMVETFWDGMGGSIYVDKVCLDKTKQCLLDHCFTPSCMIMIIQRRLRQAEDVAVTTKAL